MLTIDLVRHMKARNRRKWDEEDGLRPLNKLGLRQAEFQAEAMLAGDRIDAVYASPALRCRQSAQPLADHLGIEVMLEPLLAETVQFGGWFGSENPLLALLQARHADGGRVVAFSHADTIPAFLNALPGAEGETPPSLLSGFGGWYRVTIEGDRTSIQRHDAPDGFPSD